MYFQYTALSPDNKKLSGTIEAKDEKDARLRLGELALSITVIKPLAEAQPTASGAGIRYAFEATDQKGKKVIGTIDSGSFEEAFEKLVSDYALEVSSLTPEQIKDSEKKFYSEKLLALNKASQQKKAKEAGLAGLGAEKSKTADKEREKLLQKVDTVTQTVQAFLNEYGKDMKPEERENIRGYINQLLRIKDSTNLQHIQQTCENMLSYIEKRELFLQEARRVREQATMKVQSRTLLDTFKQTGFTKEIDVLGLLRSIQKIPFVQNFISTWFDRLLINDEQAMDLRKKIKDLKQKIWEFRKIGFRSKDPAYKKEIGEAVKELSEEKKRYVFELQGLKAKKRMESEEAEKANRLKTFGNGSLFIGWLLAFYLMFYFFTFPFSIKDFEPVSIPAAFAFYRISFLRGILILLFLLHIAVTLREEIFSRKTSLSLLLYPAAGILYLFFLFNFVI